MADMPRWVHSVKRGGKTTYRFAPYRSTSLQEAARPFWRSLGSDRAKAAEEAKRLADELAPILVGLKTSPSHEQIEDVLVARVRASKQRAKEKGLEFSITARDMINMVRVNGYKCPVSGIEFSMKTWGRRKPFAPSIDRIDPGLGYVPDNVRVVSSIANMAMSDWGLTALQTFAKGVAKTTTELRALYPLAEFCTPADAA